MPTKKKADAKKSSPKEKSNLNARVLSSLFMIPLVMGVVYAGSPLFNVFLACLTLLMCLEWDMMLSKERTSFAAYISIFIILLSSYTLINISAGMVALMVSFPFLCLFFLMKLRKTKNEALYVTGAIFISLFAISSSYINEAVGFKALAWLLGIVWFTDIGAYTAGKTIGGPKFFPSISPNKTWAGFFGGIFGSILWTGIYLNFVDINLPTPICPCFILALIGIAVSVIGQAGDLLESAAKRKLKVKDSGDLIPGHGGILDRTDSLIFATIFLAFIHYLSANDISVIFHF